MCLYDNPMDNLWLKVGCNILTQLGQFCSHPTGSVLFSSNWVSSTIE